MLNTKKTKHLVSLITGCMMLTTSCNNDDNSSDDGGSNPDSKFFIAATLDNATYFLTADELESGSVTIQGKGIEVPQSFTHLVNGNNNAITALYYQQGNPGIGQSFRLDDAGKLTKMSGEFQLTSGYNTVGTFENFIVAGRNATLASTNATGASFYFVDQSTGIVSSKDFDSRSLNPGGDAPVFAGIMDRGNGEWLSAYTKNTNNVDSVWVAAFDKDFKLLRTYKDNRLSYSAGRFRSARYSQIANDDNGNTYVFSGSYEATSTKPAGVIRINKGATTFDPSYYFNIQEKTNGYKFRRVWHASGDYFLLEFYNDTTVSSQGAATQYGIVNVTSKDFKWVTSGFPAKTEITATGWPLLYNGKVYFPVVSTANSYPTVYVIDPATATAKAGLQIQSGGVLGLGILKK